MAVKTAMTLSSRRARNSSGLVSSTVADSPRPALLTRTSIRPQREEATSSTIARTAARIGHVEAVDGHLPPAERLSASRSRRSRRRADRHAHPRPCQDTRRRSPFPADAPVTIATLPASTSSTRWPGGYLPVTALTASWVTETIRSSCSSVMTSAGEKKMFSIRARVITPRLLISCMSRSPIFWSAP